MGKQNREVIDPKSVIDDFFKYVEQYRRASEALKSAKDILWPTQQTRGLLIELTLKTFLCACGRVVKGHDLEKLASEAVQDGLTLTDKDHQNIIGSTNHIYYRGKAWDFSYICRYPMPNRGTLVTVTPSHEMVDEMVQRIIDQANEKRNKVASN